MDITPWKGVRLEGNRPPFKVLVITPDFPPHYTGGCAFSCSLLVEGLRARGVPTDVWAFNGDQLPARKGEMGETRYLRTSRTLLGLNRLAYRELSRRRPDCDIIHVYNTQQLPAAVRYARRHGMKVTATLNNLAPICTNPSRYVEGECAGCGPLDTLSCSLRRPGPLKMRAFMPIHWMEFEMLHRLSRKADGYIALSEATRQCYLDAGYSAQRIRLIPNMFDPGLSSVPERPEASKHKKIILYVGRLEVEKGLQVLIRAFAELHEGGILYLVGKGDYEPQLKRLVGQLGLEGRVIFTGFMEKEETGRYYGMADIFVHPALWPEPFPRTILEALSYHLPMVVSDSGSSASILGAAGIPFRNGDHFDLARKLELLMDDPGLRERTVLAGEEVLKRYHPDTVMFQILDFYASLLS